jgi:hypothetical protein
MSSSWKYPFGFAGIMGCIVLMSQPALAELPNPPNTVTVQAPSSGPVVANGSVGTSDTGISAAASSSSPGSGNSGTVGSESNGGYHFIPVPDGLTSTAVVPVQIGTNGTILKPPTVATAACQAGETGYYMYGPDGSMLGIVCVPSAPGVGAGPGNPVGGLVQQASDHQPWPSLTVAANPSTGLTGIPSWFWLGGGSASMPTASATAGALNVTVRAELVDIVWDFGDGSLPYSSKTSLGRAYPAESDIAHTYQTDSYGLPGGYVATASLRFSVSYSVNGGPWTGFGTKVRTYQTAYPVYQVQPEAVSTR